VQISLKRIELSGAPNVQVLGNLIVKVRCIIHQQMFGQKAICFAIPKTEKIAVDILGSANFRVMVSYHIASSVYGMFNMAVNLRLRKIISLSIGGVPSAPNTLSETWLLKLFINNCIYR